VVLFRVLYKPIIKKLKTDEREEWKKLEFDLNFLVKDFKNRRLQKILKNGGGFWEFILEQLKFYKKFIELAKVDRKTGKIYFRERSQNPMDLWGTLIALMSNKNNSNKLKDYWERQGETVHHDLYALYFDYSAKMFLEGIRFFDLDQAYNYLYNLRELSNNLQTTKYASEYDKHLKKYNELYNHLKQRLNGNEDDFKNKFSEYLEYYSSGRFS